MKEYTLGFLFNSDLSQVVLIEKTHPDYQAGLLNGIGGTKNECSEGYANAHEEMSREFQEETGVLIAPMEWDLFSILTAKTYKIYCFYFVSVGNYHFNQTKTLTKEIVRKLSISFLIHNQHLLVNKTLWLILMAMESIRTNRRDFFNIVID